MSTVSTSVGTEDELQLRKTMSDSYIPISGTRIDELTKKAEVVGARIYVIRRVRVQQDRSWRDAVISAGSNAPIDEDIFSVGDQYQAISTGIIEKDIVLLTYRTGGGDWNKALKWGDDAKLKRTVPRDVFAIGEQNPTLHFTLGHTPTYVVTTTNCILRGRSRSCLVWWGNLGYGANLGWVNQFFLREIWFSFYE